MWVPLKCAFVLLKMNLVLFCATLVCLKPTLASMKSDVSQSKDTRFNQTLFSLSVRRSVIALSGTIPANESAVMWLVQRGRPVPNPLCYASLEHLCRLIVFKILAQSVILGCTWVLGLYQANLFFQVLFILLNSQQGTFLFIVHCLLNKEVGPNQEYFLWFIFIQDSKNSTMFIQLVYLQL